MTSKITLEISDKALDAIGVSYSAFLEFNAPVLPPHTRQETLRRPPMEVACLVDIGDGVYRLGGEFVSDYIEGRTGVKAGRASDLHLTRQLGPDSNLDADPYNGGENNIN